MADKKPLAGLGKETTLDHVLYVLTAILEKLPRLDQFDRLITNPSEVAPATTPISGNIGTVTTVATATNLTNLNNLAGGNTAPMPYQISNMGALHLYNQIEVT